MQTLNFPRKFKKIWKQTYTLAAWDVESLLKKEKEKENNTETNITYDPNHVKHIVRCPYCRKFVASVEKKIKVIEGSVLLVCPHCSHQGGHWSVIYLINDYAPTKTDLVITESQVKDDSWKTLVIEFLADHQNGKFLYSSDNVIDKCNTWNDNGEVFDVAID